MRSLQELLVEVVEKLDRVQSRLDAIAPIAEPSAVAARPARLTVAQAAKEANTSPDTIRRALYARELRYSQARAGGAIRIQPDDLAEWQARGTVNAIGPLRRRAR